MNANDMGIGAIMMQEYMVIAYESKMSNNAQLIYPIHDFFLKKIVSCNESLALSSIG